MLLHSIVLFLLDSDLLHYIETELQNYYKKVKINKEKKWKEGEICIAQYHHNQKWYRGRIVNNLGNVVQVKNNLLFLTIILFLSIIFALLFLDRVCLIV